MIKCEICGREFETFKPLGNHVSHTHKLKSKEYYDKYLKRDSEGICVKCGKETKFTYLSTGYNEFCSCKCSNHSPEIINKRIKKTFEKNYNVSHPLKLDNFKSKQRSTMKNLYGKEFYVQTEDGKDKIKKTCLERYNVENPMQSTEIREKVVKTNLDKYGVENYSQTEEFKEKSKQTCINKYGVDSYSKTEECKERIKQTCLEKYGVENYLQTKEFREKSRQTCLEKYGVENPTQDDEIKQRIVESFKKTFKENKEEILQKKRETSLRNFGVEYPSRSPEVREKFKQTCLERYGVENPSFLEEIINKIQKVRRKTCFKKILNKSKIYNNVEPLFKESDFTDTSCVYKWKCKKCEAEFEDHLKNGKIPRCPSCYPLLSSSRQEREISEFCKQFYPNLIDNDRSVLDGKFELDIYIPEINLAIEFDGLYWHSDISGNTGSKYHQMKTKLCKAKDIQLIHIFEDEWINKRSIVESILKSKMNKIDNKVFARKCEIIELNKELSEEFLNENHIQGYIGGISYGLMLNDEIFSILTVGKTRFNKNYEWEILRFCNKLDTIVVGGFSKLLKHFIENKNPISLVTYADNRYSDGNLYSKNGFNLIGESSPNYFYLDKNYNYRMSRQKFQKHKLENLLENFVPELSEWKNMQLNGYDRIWDCGNCVFEYSKI